MEYSSTFEIVYSQMKFSYDINLLFIAIIALLMWLFRSILFQNEGHLFIYFSFMISIDIIWQVLPMTFFNEANTEQLTVYNTIVDNKFIIKTEFYPGK